MITVSIVSHGQASLVEALLSDFARIADPTVTRILVTMNIPERAIVADASLPVTFLRNATPRGFGANHNATFRHVDTPWFAILNPDIRLPTNPFPALLNAFDAPNVGLVAPEIVDTEGRREDSARSLITPWRLIARRFGRSAPDRDPDWLAGMFLMCRSDLFRALGGFDERYFMYCEDADLSARVRLAGSRLRVVPTARAIHDARRASHRSMRHLMWHLSSLRRMWTSAAFWDYRRLLRARMSSKDR